MSRAVHRSGRFLIGLVLIAVAADLGTWPDGAEPTQPPLGAFSVEPEAAFPILVGAGDIGSCDSNNDEATAALLDGVVASNENVTVFTTGDHAYPNGRQAEFVNCYGPTWGRHKPRTRPSAGNHDYNTADAAGYYGYFGAAAGDAGAGYYDYTLGQWHVIALNGNCWAVGGCGGSSPQVQWLRSVLAGSSAQCTVAYWHQPRFSSGPHGSDQAYQPFWEALYEAGADLVLAGHDHVYERFAPQTPTGQADSSFGLRQFTIGTGGRSLYAFRTVRPNSEFRNNANYGILELTLRNGAYDWRMIRVGDVVVDSGTGNCHGAP